MGNMGYPELLILFAIILLLFGGKNLPKLANSMGRAINDFKKGLSGVDQELRKEVEREEEAARKATLEHRSEVRTADAHTTNNAEDHKG